MTRVHSGQRGPFMQDFGMTRLKNSGSDCSVGASSREVPGKIALIQPILFALQSLFELSGRSGYGSISAADAGFRG